MLCWNGFENHCVSHKQTHTPRPIFLWSLACSGKPDDTELAFISSAPTRAHKLRVYDQNTASTPLRACVFRECSLFVSRPPSALGSLCSITAQYAWNQTNTLAIGKANSSSAPCCHLRHSMVSVLCVCVSAGIGIMEVSAQLPVTWWSWQVRVCVFVCHRWVCVRIWKGNRDLSSVFGLGACVSVHICTHCRCAAANDSLSFRSRLDPTLSASSIVSQ